MGKRRDAKLAAAVAEGIAKAGALAATATQIPASQIITEQINAPSLARALTRDSGTFGSQLGPNYPLIPFALDPLGPNGRPDPRKFQYDISWNLQVTRELAKWNILKAASEQCDVVARAITIRASEVAKMDKSWIVSDEGIAAIADREGVGTAEASSIAREENKELIAKLNEFWDNPYPQSDRGWREWITEAIWQIMVYDGLAIHPQMSLGRNVLGFNIIDASTIKILLNNYGDTPRPPDPAFQQILFGFPRGEFTATPDKSTAMFVDGQFGTTMRDQLSYFVMNKRTWTPYGFSPTEQAIPLVNLYLEYQKMMLFEFKHGTSSDVYMKTTGNDITLANIANWERVYNDWSEGDTANRKKTRLLPEGFDPVFGTSVDEKFKPDYIESVLKRLAGIFGISSQQLGVIPRAGMGGGKGAQEGDQDNAETVSSKPMMNFIEEFVNSLSRRYLGATKAVTFVLQDDKGGQDDVMIANAAKINVESAIMTVNEQRRELGMPDYDFPGADEPFIVAGNTVVYLRGAFSATQAQPQGQESQEPEGEVSSDSGQAPETDVNAKADEVKAFKRFMAKPHSREFVFKYHSPDEAEILKAGLAPRPKSSITRKRKAEDLPQHAQITELAKKHAKSLSVALTAGVGGIDEAVTTAVRETLGATAPELPNIVQALVLRLVTFDNSQAQDVLGQIYEDAGKIGADAAAKSLDAAVVSSQSTAELLANRGIVLKGINDGQLSRISTAIRDGLISNSSTKDITDAVNAVVADTKRANVIAITESNRAMSQSFVDQLSASGEATFDWVNEDEPCSECEAELGQHPITDDPPPLHPNCRCVPVVSESPNGKTTAV